MGSTKMENEVMVVGGNKVSWAYKYEEFSNKDTLQKSIKYAEYSWWDILVAFNVMGIVPTKEQEIEIKTNLVRKKYAYLSK